MKRKGYSVFDIAIGCLSFLLLFVLAVKVWEVLLSGKSGRRVGALIILFLLGLLMDGLFHTGLFLKNE